MVPAWRGNETEYETVMERVSLEELQKNAYRVLGLAAGVPARHVVTEPV